MRTRPAQGSTRPASRARTTRMLLRVRCPVPRIPSSVYWPSMYSCCRSGLQVCFWQPFEDSVHQPIFLGLLGGHELVPIRVLLDPLQCLPRVLEEDVVQVFLEPVNSFRWIRISVVVPSVPARG